MLMSGVPCANCKEHNASNIKDDELEIAFPALSSTSRTLEETERNHIKKILAETRWRIEGKGGAAIILGIHPSTLRARMHKLGILRPPTKEPD
jgi:formate hydrogenlyase transcriptional activator